VLALDVAVDTVRLRTGSPVRALGGRRESCVWKRLRRTEVVRVGAEGGERGGSVRGARVRVLAIREVLLGLVEEIGGWLGG
jgi:hypothetical protein